MFSEIFANRQISPRQTYLIILCSIGVTVATIFFSNLEHVFGSFDEDTSFINRLSLVFQHGFDSVSAIIHLIVDVVMIFILGSFIEKVLGSFYFFILNLSAFFLYIFIHHIFSMTGHGGSGIIWAYIPVVLYILNEGRILKPRSVFDEFYRYLRNLVFGIIFIYPVIMSIAPIYFDSEIPFWQSFILGNIFHLTGLISGFTFIYFYKNKIFVSLKHFARKKKFDQQQINRSRSYYFLFYPALVVAGFILLRL